ncbi:MAG: glycosyltransferase family 1 protein [Chloroflexi bacterium]|nr:MAG: glycosyltransferase family 1 protein [Chloroflexota bacterium]MBL1193176.1 glycosyltransferase family 1 protein [Chloroflexota bacterium]NOH10469.1 glycosyltransferase family 4 protein [Chloroflexota bacterium]
MKVGVVVDNYTPEDGGAYTFQAEVVRVLTRLASDCQHDFVFLSRDPDAIRNDINGDLEAVRLPKAGLLDKLRSRLGRDYPSLRRTRRWLSPLDKAANKAELDFLWFLGPRSQETDTPFLTIVLDLQHRLQPWFPEVSAHGEWASREGPLSKHLRRAAGIIAGTQAGKAEIERFYQVPGERVHILPHPTPAYVLEESESGGQEVLDKYGLQPGYLFYPAQFWAHKNHANLLQALKLLRDEHDLKLDLVLSGADYGNLAYVEQLVGELRLEEQVHFLGFVPQADLPALYKNAFALTYLTLFGPENLPPLEAFALGCPVVASNVSGAEEQLGDAAMLVEPTNPAQIANVIRLLHDDHEMRQTLVARGLRRASKWTVDDFVRSVFAILDDFAPLRRTWGSS